MNFINSVQTTNVHGALQSIQNKLPNAPTSLAYVANSATINQVIISFTAPTNVPILTYSPSIGSGTGTPSSYTISGLTSNTSYNLTLIANGIFKSSVSSSPALSILTKPGAPTIGTVTVSTTTATASFTAPSGNGTITSYTATSNVGGLTSTGTTSPITITGLASGTAYTFTVTATNASGTSVASSASNSVTPAATPTFTISSVTNWQTGDIVGTSLVNGITYKIYVFKKSGVSYTVNYTLNSPGQVYMLAVGGGGGGWGGGSASAIGGAGGIGGGGGGILGAVTWPTGIGIGGGSGISAPTAPSGSNGGTGGANTGGGGGGANNGGGGLGGSGGSGIVILAFT
jgi:hypothetical protein